MENIFIEFKAVDKRGEKPYVFNKSNINYFRPYINKEGKNDGTYIFLKGSEKGVIVPISHEVVKRKLMKTAEIVELLNKLNKEEIDELAIHIDAKYGNLV